MKKDVRLKITGTVNIHERGEEPRSDVIEYITEGVGTGAGISRR